MNIYQTYPIPVSNRITSLICFDTKLTSTINIPEHIIHTYRPLDVASEIQDEIKMHLREVYPRLPKIPSAILKPSDLFNRINLMLEIFSV